MSRTAPTAAVAGLATTGTSVQPMLIIGLVLLAAGAAVMVAEGRRRS